LQSREHWSLPPVQLKSRQVLPPKRSSSQTSFSSSSPLPHSGGASVVDEVESSVVESSVVEVVVPSEVEEVEEVEVDEEVPVDEEVELLSPVEAVLEVEEAVAETIVAAELDPSGRHSELGAWATQPSSAASQTLQ
jgi:hypothetical protein